MWHYQSPLGALRERNHSSWNEFPINSLNISSKSNLNDHSLEMQFKLRLKCLYKHTMVEIKKAKINIQRLWKQNCSAAASQVSTLCRNGRLFTFFGIIWTNTSTVKTVVYWWSLSETLWWRAKVWIWANRPLASDSECLSNSQSSN